MPPVLPVFHRLPGSGMALGKNCRIVAFDLRRVVVLIDIFPRGGFENVDEASRSCSNGFACRCETTDAEGASTPAELVMRTGGKAPAVERKEI